MPVSVQEAFGQYTYQYALTDLPTLKVADGHCRSLPTELFCPVLNHFFGTETLP